MPNILPKTISYIRMRFLVKYSLNLFRQPHFFIRLHVINFVEGFDVQRILCLFAEKGYEITRML